jgi:protein SCO1
VPHRPDPAHPVDRRAVVAGLAATLFAAGTWPARAGEPGPRFALVDQDGRAVTDRDMAGKPVLLHIGFTRCPVICPTTLYELSQRMEELGPQADLIRFVFVTVDPERDTPAVLKEYVGSFDERILALGGAPADIARLVADLGATVTRRVDDSGDYTFDHTYVGYTFDRRWQKLGTVFAGADSNPAAVLRDLKALAASA